MSFDNGGQWRSLVESVKLAAWMESLRESTDGNAPDICVRFSRFVHFRAAVDARLHVKYADDCAILVDYVDDATLALEVLTLSQHIRTRSELGWDWRASWS